MGGKEKTIDYLYYVIGELEEFADRVQERVETHKCASAGNEKAVNSELLGLIASFGYSRGRAKCVIDLLENS